jgi:hypothetical protein
VAIGHIRNHLALARKLNDHLGGGKDGAHAIKMESWLSTLEAQLTASMPRVYKANAPDINVTWEWVEGFCEDMVDQIAWDMEQYQCMTHRTAIRNQQALVAALVTGCYCPPPRIHVIKSMLHPNFEGGCQDPDCNVTRLGGTCLGNHLEFTERPPPIEAEMLSHSWCHFDYLTTDISTVVVHHKNDRYGVAGWRGGMAWEFVGGREEVAGQDLSWTPMKHVLSTSIRRGDKGNPLTYQFPGGPLTKLMLAHIYEGHKLITQGTGRDVPQLCTSSAGNAFTDVTFSQYWRTLMQKSVTKGQPPFAPSLARTMFIEEFTR